MTKLLDFLSSTRIIIASLIIMMVIGVVFSFMPRLVGGELLDMQMSAIDANARLSEMSSWHKSNHIFITLFLDSLYPLAYGGFLAGIAARFAKPWRKFAVIPAFATIIVDFAENLVQVVALAGSENILILKNIITPIKFGGLFFAAILALILLLIALVKWMRKQLN
ncbi:MAG: hypothetical protein COB92_04865 [Robiginitomaculum sp.]|nr:MAG: hypothetical protein COB92_04865 [Robiginitomaculum sp.]